MSDVQAEPATWFAIDFDDNTDGITSEAGLSGAPAALLRRLRELVPTWQSRGITPGSTSGWYEDGRLCVLIDLTDHGGRMSLGSLRLEIEDSAWDAGWVTSSGAGMDRLDEADPQDRSGAEFTDASSGAEAASSWLVQQVERPINRYVWRSDDGEVAARLWRLEDTGSPMISSGPAELVSNPASADENVRVRP